MVQLNPNFDKLSKSYLFATIFEKLRSHNSKNVISLSVGDVSLPLVPTVAGAIKRATEEMETSPHGYGPAEGHLELREAIIQAEYPQYGFEPDEVFIGDGANTVVGSIQELFPAGIKVLVTNPTYPVYVDTNLIHGNEVVLLDTTEETGFIPVPPNTGADLAYLCTPTNPTGVAMNRNQLAAWIEWAKTHKAILIVDNVYNTFISSDEIPASIYDLPGGKEMAIELRSFSKSAGFTGLRCNYSIFPKALHVEGLHNAWLRRTHAKFNGVAYPIQRGALAALSPEGKAETQAQVDTYKHSARILREALKDETTYGGIHSPYIFWKTPNGTTSWEFFDFLLEQANLVTVPGSGFGTCGEGFIRLSSFLSEDKAIEAAKRLEDLCVST